jgi:hypothetical protein
MLLKILLTPPVPPREGGREEPGNFVGWKKTRK